MTHVRLPKRIRLPHEAYKQGDTVFHVAIRAMPGQRPFHGDRGERVWQLLMNERERPAMVLLAACLMPDHLHAILRPGERSVIRWANAFKSYGTRVSWTDRETTALWQPSFFDRRLRDEREYAACLQYVMNNPVEAGLVARPWRWALEVNRLD